MDSIKERILGSIANSIDFFEDIPNRMPAVPQRVIDAKNRVGAFSQTALNWTVYPLYEKNFKQLHLRDQVILACGGTLSATLCVMTFVVFSKAFFGMGLIGSFFVATQSLAFKKEQTKKFNDEELCRELNLMRVDVVGSKSITPDTSKRGELHDSKFAHRKEELRDVDLAIKTLNAYKPKRGLDLIKKTIVDKIDHLPEELNSEAINAPKVKVKTAIERITDTQRNMDDVHTAADAFNTALFAMQNINGLSYVLNEFSTCFKDLYEADISYTRERQRTFCEEIEAIMKRIAPHIEVTPVIFPNDSLPNEVHVEIAEN